MNVDYTLVAQWVEHSTDTRAIVGSSPTKRTIEGGALPLQVEMHAKVGEMHAYIDGMHAYKPTSKFLQ